MNQENTMAMSAPEGITPPAPNLEREEPEFATEDDIPREEDGWRWATAEIDKLGRE